MNKHIILFIHMLSLYKFGYLNTIFNYMYTFGLTEGKNPNVARERIQDSVNSTGVLFIYLYAQDAACEELHLCPLQRFTIIIQVIMGRLVILSLSRCIWKYTPKPFDWLLRLYVNLPKVFLLMEPSATKQTPNIYYY
jgi:hypothetical protein